MKSKNRPPNTLRTFNHFLSIIIFVIGLYIVLWPFIPKADFWWKNVRHIDPPLVTAVNKPGGKADIPKENILVIPELHLQQVIYEGPPYVALSKGAWRSPNGSTPDKGSNTVIAGHRFTYTGFQRGASTFYNLDELKNGDLIVVYWNQNRYDYQVYDTKVVPPQLTSIENPTDRSEITLYTCTPLWTSLNRLVVKASLVR